MNLGQVWQYAQYVVLALVAVLAVDMILDRFRTVFGRPQNEKVARAWDAFDKFCDQLRKIVGGGPLGQLARDRVATMAGIAYDLARDMFSPLWTREEWIEAVLRWYDAQMVVERIVSEAYIRAVPEETRAEIASRTWS